MLPTSMWPNVNYKKERKNTNNEVAHKPIWVGPTVCCLFLEPNIKLAFIRHCAQTCVCATKKKNLRSYNHFCPLSFPSALVKRFSASVSSPVGSALPHEASKLNTRQQEKTDEDGGCCLQSSSTSASLEMHRPHQIMAMWKTMLSRSKALADVGASRALHTSLRSHGTERHP